MFSKGSVLIVDDEINLCRILGAKLAKNGYNVVAVHDGVQAVEKVRASDYAVVLLDLILPRKDGLSVLSEIRGTRKDLPVIIMSACENSDAIDQAMKSGASAYIKKPFDLDSLVSLVRNTCSADGASGEQPPTDSSVLFVKSQPVTLDIRNQEGSRIFSSRIEDKDERTLSVLAPKVGGHVVEIPPKTPVRVGLAANDAYYSFNSYVISLRDNGRPVLIIDKPGAIYRTQRRQSPRRSLRTSAHYCRINGSGGRSGHLEHALALDLSAGGLRLALDERLLPGQLVYVELDPTEDIGSMTAVAQVIRCSESSEPDLPGFVVGLRFAEVDDQLIQALARAV